MREKVGKSQNTVFFPMICGSGGSKSRLAKAAGAEPAGQMRDEKLHALVAGSTFPSQNLQSTPRSDHFWKLRCWKSARRCGAEHMSKSKCTKHTIVGPLLEVAMSKKCTPLWREAHFQVKMHKTLQRRTTFGEVTMPKKCTPLWREAHFQVKMYIRHHVRTFFGGSDVVSRGRRKGLWTLSKVSKMWGFCSIFNYNHYTTLHLQLQLHLHYILLHYTPQHYTSLHYTTLPYTEWHCTTDRQVDR